MKKGPITIRNLNITGCCHRSQPQERLERKVITDYNELLKRKISHAFLGKVAISNILHVFNAYNVHVLNGRDIEEIQKTVDKKGEYKGGEKLLNRLCVYKGWFECLLKVLKDPSVKSSHVATALETLKDELNQEDLQGFLAQRESSEDEGNYSSSGSSIMNENLRQDVADKNKIVEELRTQVLTQKSELERAWEKGTVSDNEIKRLSELLNETREQLLEKTRELDLLKDSISRTSSLETDSAISLDDIDFATPLKIVDSEHSTGDLLCKKCHHSVAKVEDLLSIPTPVALKKSRDAICKSRQILTQLFKNPQDQYFEVKYNTNLWYPGFAWSYAHCSSCLIQLGWSFSEIKDAEDKVAAEMTSFHGLVYRKLKFDGNMFTCKECSNPLANAKHTHHIKSETALREEIESNFTLQLFKNPGEYFFDVITFLTANVNSSTMSFAANTWFEGYSWSIANCPKCDVHVGWLSTSRVVKVLA
ncbi:protein cereblon [Biomphalaria pfeifferi]|uniref:Protein cereblon n=1 Tax=Biomphalaria pfeifferi TaxID=112525 RepID=A0AAD8B115_BIOPF|nr:protein cereblon [Biomphalaria pfeifferi]